ncbi:hypothetical protein [Iodobacter fluviatilis]|uniref:Uncharacterized protein n=1 Tax=Iodobacter fluviatilis TaxID=537 RepID=A0A377Q3D3_9NEIS|nr:hypothetical protein [Iodobacter fluviatilis]TCU90241.1 hypothetical protein EV682_101266 [Iodobacter fluviatilis]STQ89268.1 Uncharacterised protein [Iodobacter fluviatilis]
MSDKIDQASDVSELMRCNAIAAHYASAKLSKDKTPQPSGECRWCSAVAVNDAVFCCEECAKDWQGHNATKQKAQRIAGR